MTTASYGADISVPPGTLIAASSPRLREEHGSFAPLRDLPRKVVLELTPSEGMVSFDMQFVEGQSDADSVSRTFVDENVGYSGTAEISSDGRRLLSLRVSELVHGEISAWMKPLAAFLESLANKHSFRRPEASVSVELEDSVKSAIWLLHELLPKIVEAALVSTRDETIARHSDA